MDPYGNADTALHLSLSWINLTPEAANVAKEFGDVERINLCYYLERARLLLDFHRQVRVRAGEVRLHLEKTNRYVKIINKRWGPFICWDVEVGRANPLPW